MVWLSYQPKRPGFGDGSVMNIGFETIGNATVICHDGVPILVTDPWLSGKAYFGSWTLSHEIPARQMEAIRQCQHAWISHGHPDHLCVDSLKSLSAKTILLPAHRGNRIYDDLCGLGLTVTVLENRKWTTLSDHVRVLSIADYNQDAILLIDVNGRLIVNINDAGDRGWGTFVKNVIRQYKVSFLLKLGGFGDADMINYFDENGGRILPPAVKREPVGEGMAIEAHLLGTKYVVPFSSMHRYQRTDSIWADQYTTDIEDYKIGFESTVSEMLPAFIRYDCERDTLEEIVPARRDIIAQDPMQFGDNWSEQLEAGEVQELNKYISAVEHLREVFDFVTFRVGGKDHVIELGRKKFERGLTFEVPRNSLMTAVRYHVFDDLLIGNFMKTTLNGQFHNANLYPDFTPYVAKYGDNGMAKTRDELREYFSAYRRQAPYDFFRHKIEANCKRVITTMTGDGSRLYHALARTYHFLKSA